MSWFDHYSKKNESLEGIFGLIGEVLKENANLTKEESSLISEDFYKNTLTEIFSGIDYSKFNRKSTNENKTLDLLLEAEEEFTPQEIKLGLPKLRISEDWGQPESADRQIIQRFTASITGNTLEEKLAAINNVTSQKVELASLGQILGTMVVLEILSTILAQFTESAGGFIFEAFLAGLFGEDSIQITDVSEEDEGATGKPITDVMLGDREYSLKLLNPKTAVKGSWKNMIEHFAGPRDHVVYLDARRPDSPKGEKGVDSLLFSEFEITLVTFLDVFYEPFKGYSKRETPVKTKEELFKVLEQHGEMAIAVQFAGPFGGRSLGRFSLKGTPGETAKPIMMRALEAHPSEEIEASVHWSEEDYTKSVSSQKLFGSAVQYQNVMDAIEEFKETGDKTNTIKALRATYGWQNPQQFLFTPNQTKKIVNEREIAFLLLGDEHLKKAWMLYGDILRKTVHPVYTFIGRFNENVSKYFMGTEDGDARKEYALAAQQDLASLKEATDEAISAVETSEHLEE
jgi:hypothetical protein